MGLHQVPVVVKTPSKRPDKKADQENKTAKKYRHGEEDPTKDSFSATSMYLAHA
jgi:hypothetical protein